MSQQMQISEIGLAEVDREGSHPGELEVAGFDLGVQVDESPSKWSMGGPAGMVIGYYRGDLVVQEPRFGTTRHLSPKNAVVAA
jgi:hypothetical protein